MRPVAVWASLLAVVVGAWLPSVAGRQLLVTETGNVDHLRVPFDLPVPFPGVQPPPWWAGNPDLPLNEPPLVRTVTGFQPEGIHLTQWTSSSILVSWQTGEDRVAPNSSPPKPHDPAAVRSIVRWGTASGRLTQTSQSDHRLVYSYKYGADAGDTTYHSPILHHVLLEGLQPDTAYYYRVGDEVEGFSPELSFTTPAASYPLRIGVVGDLGQTANSTQTLEHLVGNNPDLLMLIGDFSYADDHMSGDGSGSPEFIPGVPLSQQPRWDGWARMMQPVLSRLPLISTRGNHEVEPLRTAHNATMTAANARHPYPQDPGAPHHMTAPNVGAFYLNWDSPTTRFVNESGYQPVGGFYSLDLPGCHVISLNSYLPWGEQSQQYRWLLDDLAKVDRRKTPWLIVIFHTPVYHNYAGHFKEGDTFLAVYEDIFYQHQVDLVYSGHVHSYERSHPVYKYQRNSCGPMYTTIGDGGNVEGLYRAFIDQISPRPDFCQDPALYQLPEYQPIPYQQPVLSLQDGKCCPTSQPAWSAFREPSFGHGILEILNATHAVWEWHRNQDAGPVVADRVVISKTGACSNSGSSGIGGGIRTSTGRKT